MQHQAPVIRKTVAHGADQIFPMRSDVVKGQGFFPSPRPRHTRRGGLSQAPPWPRHCQPSPSAGRLPFTREKVPGSEPPPCPSAPPSRAAAGRQGAVADTACPARPRERATLCPLESRLTTGPFARPPERQPGPGTQGSTMAGTEVRVSLWTGAGGERLSILKVLRTQGSAGHADNSCWPPPQTLLPPLRAP